MSRDIVFVISHLGCLRILQCYGCDIPRLTLGFHTVENSRNFNELIPG